MRAAYTDSFAERLALDVACAMVRRCRARLERLDKRLHILALETDAARAALVRWCEIAEGCALAFETKPLPRTGCRVESLRRPER
jgi:hypothetical protein